jgi:AraC family transcriptional regulator
VGNIAADLQQALAQRALEGAAGRTLARPLAGGDGWTVADVLCTHGPRDRPYEEQHGGVCIAMVVAGTFGYRCAAGGALLTPGALMLGNTGTCFECGHRHGAGDRCLAFHYAPAYFERLAADAGVAAVCATPEQASDCARLFGGGADCRDGPSVRLRLE